MEFSRLVQAQPPEASLRISPAIDRALGITASSSGLEVGSERSGMAWRATWRSGPGPRDSTTRAMISPESPKLR